MKRLAIVLLLAIVLASCADKEINQVELDGKVENLDLEYALLMNKGLTDTIWLGEDGTFSMTLKAEEPSYYILRTGRVFNTLYLIPDQNLTVYLDVKSPKESLRFEGSLANKNHYIFDVNDVLSTVMSDFRTLYSLPLDGFTFKLDSIKAEAYSLLEIANFKNEDFTSSEKARYEYRLMGVLYDYPNYNARLTGQEYVYNSDDFDFIKEVDFGNINHFGINEYTSLLNKHLQQEYWSELGKDEHKEKSDVERKLLFFDIVNLHVDNQVIGDFIKHQFAIQSVQWESLDVGKEVANFFISNATNNNYIDLVETALANRMLLAPGKPAPEFSLEGIDGQIYSLSDFNGQLVYLDFWATWCGPCRREIPYLKTLKDAYDGKPVAFVAISLDDDKDAWVKMVNDEQLKGYQLHADKAWSSDAAQKYQIRGVPTFILIDGEGKIIEYNSPRPSDPGITLLIDEHLKNL